MSKKLQSNDKEEILRQIDRLEQVFTKVQDDTRRLMEIVIGNQKDISVLKEEIRDIKEDQKVTRNFWLQVKLVAFGEVLGVATGLLIVWLTK